MSGIKKYFVSPNSECKLNEGIVLEPNKVILRSKSKKGNYAKIKQSPLYVYEKDDSNDAELIHKQAYELASDKDISKKLAKTTAKAKRESKKKIQSKDISTKRSSQSESENSEDCNSSVKSHNETGYKGTNAFQVMMDARNRSIGTNSPGKEREESELLIDQNKDVLAKRRIKFEAWAAEKGGLKRKMTEEIIDVQIKQEMNKRAKRLKKLLTNDQEEKSSNSKVASVLENKVIEKLNNDHNSTLLKKRRPVRKECNILKSQGENRANLRKSSDCKNNATNDIKKISLNLRNSESLNVEKGTIILNEDDKSNDEFLLKLSSPMKRNKNLLSYFDKTNSNDENTIREQSTPLNIQTRISDTDISCIVHKTPKSKTKLLTPGSKWKIRMVNTSTDHDINKSNDSCIELYDSLSEAEISQNSINAKAIHGPNGDLSNKTTDIKFSKARKLAPLFERVEKCVPSEKQLKAKEEFLKSGVPEKFRLQLEKQNSYERILYPTFPSISHIQQCTDAYIWNLPRETLNFLGLTNNLDNKSINFGVINSLLRLGTFTQCKRVHCNNETLQFNMNTYVPPERIQNSKNILKLIKTGFPEFPVYKTFRILKEKSESRSKLLTVQNVHNNEGNEKNIKHNKSRKSQKRPKKIKSKENIDVNPISESHGETNNNFLWSDVFCPSNSNEFIGNSTAINNLKDWLIQWKEFNVMKYKNSNYDSDCSYNSDADFAESNDSFCSSANFKTLKNTTLLLGPIGSGKTSIIYSLANELGYNVIELNASSRRTGKIVFTKLQEATQSHRVRSKDKILSHITDSAIKLSDVKKHKRKTSLEHQLLSSLKTKTAYENNSLPNGASKVLSLILVEDIDIVFDQDDGFISALSQIVQTSKRPIVFTSSDKNNFNVQKFMNNLVIKFKLANPIIMTTWLQILCLVNNLYIDNASIFQLLDMYNGDMRKTLLQLQYWVLSGGDMNAKPQPQNVHIKKDCTNHKILSKEDTELYPDESSNLSNIEEKDFGQEKYSCHKKCLLCTCSLKNTVACEHLFTLEYLWLHSDIGKLNSKFEAEKLQNQNGCDKHMLAEFFDTASYIDLILSKVQMIKEKEMCSNFHVQHINDYLLNCLYLKSEVDPHLYHKSKEDYSRSRQDIHRSLNIFCAAASERIPNSSKLLYEPPENPKYSKAFTLDYSPTLRTICRAEKQRSEANMKRMTSKRFYHYLKILDVHFTDDMLNFACNSLS